jgi:rhamnosyltransferase
MSARSDIAAYIVAFRPDAALITALAKAVGPQVGALYVFNNGGVSDALAQSLRYAGAELVGGGRNVGVAEAFNACAQKAAVAGKTRLLLLDQDSNVAPDMVDALATRMDGLVAAGERVAVIGPRIVSPPDADFKAPRYFPRSSLATRVGARPVQYVISSGSLIDLNTLREVGPFRADFFIDAIDTEWCFRAWARGASCWVADDVTMVHRIGDGVVRGLGNAMPRQPDFRLYAYVRNQAHCLTLPHIPLAWKARFAMHLMRVVLVSWIDRGCRLSFLGAMMQAAWRGLRGKLGPPPGAQNVD